MNTWWQNLAFHRKCQPPFQDFVPGNSMMLKEFMIFLTVPAQCNNNQLELFFKKMLTLLLFVLWSFWGE